MTPPGAELSQARRPWQFSLRTGLLAMFAAAVALANWRSLLTILYEVSLHYFYPIAGASVVAAFWIGRLLRRHFLPHPFRNRELRLLILALWITMPLAAWLIWAQRCWVALMEGALDTTIRPWPYPDDLLARFHEWVDQMLPAAPGTFKIHREVYLVWAIINVATWLVFCLAALLLGIAWPWERNSSAAEKRSTNGST